jgi:hypothetical protein
MTGSQLLGLLDPLQVKSRSECAHLFSTMTYDYGQAGRLQGQRSVYDMMQ